MKKFGRAIVSRYNSYRLKERSKLYLYNTLSFIYFTFQPFFWKEALTEEFTNASYFIFYTYARDKTYIRESTSVARGGQGGIYCLPIMLFRSFVGTFGICQYM